MNFINKIKWLNAKSMIFEIYSLYLNELLRASCPSPFGPAELFKFVPDKLVRKNLASSANSSLRCSTTYIPVGGLARPPFHLRQAFLPAWLIRGCSSVSNPFIGEKIHRIFYFIRFTHSYGYGSAGDRATLFARFPLIFVPFTQYVG